MLKFEKIRRNVQLLFIFIFAAVLAGCASKPTPVVYNLSSPPNQLSTLRITDKLWVYTCDGESVYWHHDTAILIPSGFHKLEYRQLDKQGGSIISEIISLVGDLKGTLYSLEYNFQPGMIYELEGKESKAKIVQVRR
jgi:hypothetical protein